ncbi:MAG: beta-galactosidase, partial [Bacteroidales bacterium]|nr:beta-galactosidase [Bacteroidales bacterium]
MKNTSPLFTVIIILLFSSSCSEDAPRWQMAPVSIQTKWAETVNPENPWPEYPRPQLVRSDWESLNGLWEYAIRPIEQSQPDSWDGNILVPYPVESALSGVQKQVGKDSILWYKHSFEVPSAWRGKRVILHFEAVDWESTLWINGEKAGIHKGGYDPFSFDITDYLSDKGKQDMLLRVWDPTDAGTQARGKQVSNPKGIWYTSTTGIWQTVWMEPVNNTYISSIFTAPDIDKKTLTLRVNAENIIAGDQVQASVYYKNKLLTNTIMSPGEPGVLKLQNPHLWSPESPVLYDLVVQVIRDQKSLDHIKSYFGMRKISLGKDEEGFTRILLNNQFVFQNGPLDQGFWPDGIYTPPSDKAMKYDLKMIKKMGFNMLRKHVKVENRRFYYWCDKKGILVWQDMPNGDRHIRPSEPDFERTEESAAQYKLELTRMIETKYNHPSIVIWFPFNEGWGQFNTAGIVQLIREIDPIRLVNSASGWTDRNVGDMMDLHHYPEPICPEPEENRAIVLGEFGGLGLPIPGHTWIEENWGYKKLKTEDELIKQYEEFYLQVWEFADQGLSAAIYTQITDVET